MRDFLKAILCDQSGATAVEYALILGLVFLAMIAAVQGFGTSTIGMWEGVGAKIAAAIADGS